MKRIAVLAVALMALSLPAWGQAPQLQTFTVTSMAGSFPGGKSAVVANITEPTITFSQYLDVKAESLLAASTASSGMDGYWGGGGNINLPKFSTAVNNASPTINGFTLKLSIPFSVGDAKVTDASGNSRYHLGWTAGGRLFYSLDKGQTYNLGGGAEYSGIPYHRGMIYYLGLKIHI